MRLGRESYMNIDLSSVRSNGTTKHAASTGSSLDARIAALKKKMVDLFNELKALLKNPGEDSEKQAEAIQQQIQLLQLQIQQLEALKKQQEKAAEKDQAIATPSNTTVNSSEATSDTKVGTTIDSYS